MSGSLERRLRLLEDRLGSEEPCGTCGFDGDWNSVEFVTSVTVIHTPDEVDRASQYPERCPECRFPHVIKVTGERGEGRR